jgi:hypothetical protein
MNSVLQTKAIPDVMPLARNSGLFVSLCTIMAPDGTLIDAGQPSGNYVNVAGIVNIPCTAPPEAIGERLSANETRAQDDIQAFAPRHVLLSGFFPSIQVGVSQGWIAVIDGRVYTLLGAESDSQSQMTRLRVRFAGV